LSVLFPPAQGYLRCESLRCLLIPFLLEIPLYDALLEKILDPRGRPLPLVRRTTYLLPVPVWSNRTNLRDSAPMVLQDYNLSLSAAATPHRNGMVFHSFLLSGFFKGSASFLVLRAHRCPTPHCRERFRIYPDRARTPPPI